MSPWPVAAVALAVVVAPLVEAARMHSGAVREALGEKGESVTEEPVLVDVSTLDASDPTHFLHWLGNDNVRIDEAKAEAKLRQTAPSILHEWENVLLAFKVGRDKTYFTEYRIILRPKSSVSSSKVTYHSIPYESVKAYSLRTAGLWPNVQADLKLWTSLPALPELHIGFRKGYVNIFDVGILLGRKVLDLDRLEIRSSLLDASFNASAAASERWLSDAIAWMGSDAAQISAEEAEKKLRESTPLLGANERVHLAFKVGRDITLMTSRRILSIDVQGISGKSVEYTIIPYKIIKAFMVQTAGTFDFDAEMRVWTDLPGMRDFSLELQAGRANVKAVQALLSDEVLGVSDTQHDLQTWSLAQHYPEDHDGPFDIFHWLGNNHLQVDARDAEAAIRRQGVLQPRGEEWVLMAFRVGRDMNLLTNKRLLMIDIKGFGKKVEYKTIPYHAIRAYAVQTAGHFDGDSELMIWTGIQPPPPMPPSGGDGPPPPPPCPTLPHWHDCLSFVTFDLQRGRADLLGIQKLLSAYVLGFGDHELENSLLQGTSLQALEDPMADLYHYLDDNAAQVSPFTTEQQFKHGGILQPDEAVELAFRLGTDFMLWTSKRLLLVDRQGWMGYGRKALYRSIPYSAIRAFAFTSAGSWDSDAELEFWTDMPWLPYYKQDLRRGHADLSQIMQVLGRKVAQPRRALTPGFAGALLEQNGERWISDTLAYFGGDASSVDAEAANTEFHTEKPIMGADEEVKFACQVGRDRTLLTSTRVLLVDVQGLSGRRVEYKSVPYNSVGSFLVRSAGSFDRDSEMRLFTDVHGIPSIQQDFLWDKVSIFHVSSILTQGVFEAIVRQQ